MKCVLPGAEKIRRRHSASADVEEGGRRVSGWTGEHRPARSLAQDELPDCVPRVHQGQVALLADAERKGRRRGESAPAQALRRGRRCRPRDDQSPLLCPSLCISLSPPLSLSISPLSFSPLFFFFALSLCFFSFFPSSTLCLCLSMRLYFYLFLFSSVCTSLMSVSPSYLPMPRLFNFSFLSLFLIFIYAEL